VNFKTLIVRWIVAGLGLFLLAFGYAGIWQNADPIAKWIAPTYVGLSEEEIFRQSNIPCVRPVGKKSGCSYPDVETATPTGDEWQDRNNGKLAELERFRQAIAIQTPEARHYDQYFEREVLPRRNRVTLWTGILFSLAAVAISVYVLGGTRAWCKTVAATDVARVKRRFFKPGWILAVRNTIASRRLRRLDSDFKALYNLHQNGIISDEDFEQMKQALRATIK